MQMEIDWPQEPKIVGMLTHFEGMGTRPIIASMAHPQGTVPVFVNEYWTAKQRAAHSIQEVSYRACFKPQLPRFFIERLTHPGDLVYDPFMGRGTTLVEAALMDRRVAGCDVNPLSEILVLPRINPPMDAEISARMASLDLRFDGELREDLLAFYHPDTLRELHALRRIWVENPDSLSPVDAWIRMVATNRLTGHSPGFFSVYTLPPNQAVTVKRQLLINEKRQQIPPYRNVRDIILKKSRNLLKDLSTMEREAMGRVAPQARLHSCNCADEGAISVEPGSVDLAVTSPPFLGVVDYATDNWLRCWFNGIDPEAIGIWQFRKIGAWESAMKQALEVTRKLLKPGGYFAFEVGEVEKGTVKLEENVVKLGLMTGYAVDAVMIHEQEFTKTSQCWGVDNRSRGTNTHRIVLMRNPQ